MERKQMEKEANERMQVHMREQTIETRRRAEKTKEVRRKHMMVDANVGLGIAKEGKL